MTIEKVEELVDSMYGIYYSNYGMGNEKENNEYVEAKNIVKNLLNKEKPKRMVIWCDGTIGSKKESEFHCMKCDYSFGTSTCYSLYSYCPHCGQRMSWRGV